MVRFFSGLIKLISGVLALPIAWGVSVSFVRELQTIDPDVGKYFFLGVITYLLLHLLVCKPSGLYARGNKFLQVVFGFSKVFAVIASYLVPVFAVALVLIYAIAGYFTAVSSYLYLLLFFVGFSVGLHFLLGAEDLRSQSGDWLKINYFAGVIFIWIFSVGFTAVVLHSLRTGFYFNEFIAGAWGVCVSGYTNLRQLAASAIF